MGIWFALTLTGEGPFTVVYSVMANWGANHSASSFGHIGADLITLASILTHIAAINIQPHDNLIHDNLIHSFR